MRDYCQIKTTHDPHCTMRAFLIVNVQGDFISPLDSLQDTVQNFTITNDKSRTK